MSRVIEDTEDERRRKDEMLRKLEAEGALLRFPPLKQAPAHGFRPLVVEGEPVSDTIIKDRR